MAVRTKKGKGVDKWRKKKYFSILSPKMFQERELGQTIAYDSASVKGRRITANLMVLLGNIKKQQVNMTFLVTKMQGDTGYTMVEKYEILPAAIKRKVRRYRDRLDESFICVTRDNKRVRMKPMVMTAVRTSGSVKIDLRHKILSFIIQTVKKIDYDALVMELVNDRFQRETANYLKKIVPIRSVDIRVMKYLGDASVEGVESVSKSVDVKREPEKKPAQETTVTKDTTSDVKPNDSAVEVETKPEVKISDKPEIIEA